MMMNTMNANIIQVSIYLAYVLMQAKGMSSYQVRKNAIFAQIYLNVQGEGNLILHTSKIQMHLWYKVRL